MTFLARPRLTLLHALDRYFPPAPETYMTPGGMTDYEVAKAPDSMGRYLAAVGRRDVDILDFGCGMGR